MSKSLRVTWHKISLPPVGGRGRGRLVPLPAPDPERLRGYRVPAVRLRAQPPRNRCKPPASPPRPPPPRPLRRGGDGCGARRGPGYLVVVQPRLQNLMQLPRQRVVGLRRGAARPTAETVGGPGRGHRGHLPAGLRHSDSYRSPAPRQPRPPRGASTARASCAAHAPSAETAPLSRRAGRWREAGQEEETDCLKANQI